MNKIVTKLVSAAAVAATLLSVPMSASAAAPFKYGDINGDGNINASDASIIYSLKNKKVTFNSNGTPKKNEVYFSDVNGDGVITDADAEIVLQYAAKSGAGNITLGDANDDGVVDVKDAIRVGRWIANGKQHKKNTEITLNLINANVDFDDVVDENDQDLLLNYIVGNIDEF